MEPDSPNHRRISIRDLAKHLGVSHATVSLALRDHPRISAAVREKVRKAAEELGYQPDPMLSALAHYRKEKIATPITSSLAWINAWTPANRLRSYREFDLYWEGASKAAVKYGYRLEEFRLGGGIDPERLHQILSTRGIRGILLPPQKPHPDWQDFPWGNYSVVRFGRSLKYPQCHVVTADQVANTILAFEKIRELGYQRIGFATDEASSVPSGHLFEAGFLLAQRTVEEDCRIPICVISDIPNTGRAGKLSDWIRQYRIDAILTDHAALPSILKKAGVRVPQDLGLAVTTILDMPISAGIDQQPEEIGRVALLMLNSLINDGARGIPPIFRQILVEGAWVDGPSLPPKV